MRFTGFLSFVFLAACSASPTNSGDFGDGGGASASSVTASAGSGTGGAATSSASASATSVTVVAASSGTGQPTGPAEVFAHGESTLYKLDPITKVVTTIGDFNGCDSVVDIALDKDGKMVGSASGGLYAIDKTTAACTLIAPGDYPNSLSFVPAGTLDPNVEALVGYLGNEYVRIDETTGAVTQVGSLGPTAGDLASSGDVVSVIGGGTYLTVNGTGCNDCILEVDPKTGAMKNNIGKLSHSGVFGLAFWAGTAYGFDDNGKLFAIDLTNAQCTDLPGVGTSSFWGAGSTTAAPVGPE